VSALYAASVRHLLRHPAQLLLALLGLTLGVATIVAVDVATASARRAFELSLVAVNGAASHEISGEPDGVDEQLYVRLRRLDFGTPGPPVLFAPVVSGYVTVGDSVLQLIGLDPLASEALAGGSGARAALPAGLEELRAWLIEPGAIVVSAATAAQLRLGADARLTLGVGGVAQPAHVIARIAGAGAGLDGLVLTDIAQAQEWLNAHGRLSRVDVRVPDGPDAAAALARLRSTLPPGLELHTTRAQARETFALTDAFTTNLRAMSLLALLVGLFLIYGAVSFAVLQRRTTLAVLRALGATRAQVLGTVLGEAALLGIAGALLGVLLGLTLAHSLIALVSQTINDLYFVVAVREVRLGTSELLLALAAGIATALVAALLPALEVATGAPQLGLARSVLERRSRAWAQRLAALSGLLAVAAALTVLFTQRSLLAGFAALFMLLLAVAALTPAALRALALGCAWRLRGRHPLARLACADIAASLSRTGVAVAALAMALTAMIGVAIMVQSFRESLREWLLETLRADVYVSAPGVAESLERRLDPQVISALLAVPGVRAHSAVRRVTVSAPQGTLDLNAVSLLPESHAGFHLTRGEAARAWPAFAAGAVLISEPLAWRLALTRGDTLTLDTEHGARAFPIAGVYREYGNDHGELLMDLAVYRHWWQDQGIAGLGLYLQPGVESARLIPALRAAAHGRQALLIRSNADIRALSMQIFERTFIITRVLYWLAAGVAAIGLVSALLAWELERLPELTLLRVLGLTPAASAALLLGQSVFMGLAALAAAVPAGLLTALVLTAVINRRAFGWRIDLHLNVGQFGNALLLALAAASAAALYPAWRSARAGLAQGLRAE
jgi:putative ABC transport system permease protein